MSQDPRFNRARKRRRALRKARGRLLVFAGGLAAIRACVWRAHGFPIPPPNYVYAVRDSIELDEELCERWVDPAAMAWWLP